jgi:ABC-2 type transport system permease protein
MINTIKDFLLLLKAEIKRDFIFMKRYPLEPISFLFFMYLILLAILFGFNQLAGKGLVNVEKMVLGYSLMQFVLSTQMGWSGQIQNESQTGTLEQLSISGHTLGEVLMVRGFSQMPRQILSFYLLLVLFKFSNLELNMPLLQTLPYVVLSLIIMGIGIFGLSYIFAGITLLFKRVGFFFQIINFAFLGLFWQDRSLIEGTMMGFFYDHFPLTIGMAAIQNHLRFDSNPLKVEWIYFIFHSMIYCLVGYIIFYMMERRARRLGLLSQY